MTFVQSLMLFGPHHLDWIDETLNPVGSGQIQVRTLAGAISIGSELPRYQGSARAEDGPLYPAMTGYENLAEVVAVGEGVTQHKVGDKVVAFYGHRTGALLSAERALPVPERISTAQALLTILTCDVAKGIRKLNLHPEDPVLITGAGAIGLLALFMLRAYGIQTVTVIEPLEARRNLAKKFGAVSAFVPEEFPSSLEYYAAGLECSSRDAGFALLQKYVRPNARLCILADGNLEPLTLTPAFHRKELSVVGSSDGWDYPAHAAWYFRYLREHPAVPLDDIFDMTVSHASLAETFVELAATPHRAIKVLVNYE